MLTIVLTLLTAPGGLVSAQEPNEDAAPTPLEPELSWEEWLAEPDSMLVTTTQGNAAPQSGAGDPANGLDGAELQRALSSGLAEAIGSLAGFNVQYNGPGASGVMMRGLTGDRVLILEEGHSTGDISWSADDHGMMIEVLSAERVDVIRGPATLLHGANALGGVVDIIRDDVPSQRFQAWGGRAAAQATSGDLGGAGSLVLTGPLGPTTAYIEGTARRSGDVMTPQGRLTSSSRRVFGGAVGLAAHPSWGMAGGSVRVYSSRYEVPGEFKGQQIPGGHPGGVAIEADRIAGRGLVRIEPRYGALESLEFRASASLFMQDELEGVSYGDPVSGARFEQLLVESRALATYLPLPVADGLILTQGVSGKARNLETAGLSPGARSGREIDAGLFSLAELFAGASTLQLGLRGDLRHAQTTDGRSSSHIAGRAAAPESRMFPMISAAAEFAYLLHPAVEVGVGITRASRAPNIEELFSEGPHLADYTYDIGNPYLNPEVGHGAELFMKIDRSQLDIEVAAYVSKIDRYIHAMPTGETMPVYTEGYPRRDVPVQEASGVDSIFFGGEAQLTWEFTRDFYVDAQAHLTIAQRIADGDPLPDIPPLTGSVALRYDGPLINVGSSLSLSDHQRRLPRMMADLDPQAQALPRSTAHALVRAWLGVTFETRGTKHAILAQAQNIANSTWYDGLSKISSVSPQPGLDVELSWEMSF